MTACLQILPCYVQNLCTKEFELRCRAGILHMGDKVVNDSGMVPIEFYGDVLVGKQELRVGDVCNDAPCDYQRPKPAFGINILNRNPKNFAGCLGNDPNDMQVAGAFLGWNSQVVCKAVGPNDIGQFVHKCLAVLGGIAL